MTKVLSITLILTISFLNSYAQCNSDMPNWLVGKWEIIPDSEDSFEVWTKIDDNILHGETFKVFGDEKILMDEVYIKCIDDKVVLETRAMMNEKTVKAGFVCDTDKDIIWNFYNAHTDYPASITYLKINQDTINVWMKGSTTEYPCMEALFVRVE